MDRDFSEVFENGSTWIRCDFHLHTNADKEFVFKGNTNDFFKLYVEQLKQQNIGLGIVTNHNKFDKNEFVALRKHAKRENIGLFAGVEFSLKEGIHILIAFDDKWFKGEIDYISNFLNQSFFPDTNYSNPPYPNSKLDLENTVEKLNEVGHDYFIILAHPDDRNGLFQVLQGRTKEAFISQKAFSKVLAVQKSGNLENYKQLTRLCGREIACVEGSDNAKEGIDGIGKGRMTYVKIGDFNFEALKYALIDVDNRVSSKLKPEIVNSYIKSISFEGGKLDGVHIHFSPELNSFIGIRGSGKSSIIEILRYTLGIPLSRVSIDSDYKNSLIKFVLGSGGKVILKVVNRQKDEYTIEKIYGQKEDIFRGGVIQPAITIDAFFDYPVYFGQKDLSNKDADFESELMNRLIGTKFKSTQEKILSGIKQVENVILELHKLQNLKGIKDETEALIRNSEHKLATYKTLGVEEKLKQQTQFDADISKFAQAQQGLKSYIFELETIISNYEHLFAHTVEGSEINRELFTELQKLRSQLKNEFDLIKTSIANSKRILDSISILSVNLSIKKEGLKEEFAKIKREINNDSVNPDDFLNLNRQIETAKLKLSEIEKSEIKRNGLNEVLRQKLVDLNGFWLEKFRLLELEVSKINEADNKLTIEIDFKGRKDKFLDKLLQIFKGTGIRESSYQRIVEEYIDFIEIFKDVSKLKEILSDSQFSDFFKRFNENRTELLTYKVPNKIAILYNGKPLNNHSLGQRASALILFLLAQKENDVLIIDQPEDDLDNQTIYEEVIKELKKLKGNMQFIFATHNANIPVLGDSEKVISCNYDEKNISVNAGNIDNYDIQRSIVDIMEGGDEAFSRRKNIYGIWNVKKEK